MPESFKKFKPREGEEENFLLADTAVGDKNRILIFGRQRNIDLFKNTKKWFMDGNKVAPMLFAQVYVILAEKHVAVHPIFYALLPNKSRTTYVRLFSLIKKLQPELQLRSVACDFEIAAILGIKTIFPDVAVHGCFFSFITKRQKTHCSKLTTQMLSLL